MVETYAAAGVSIVIPTFGRDRVLTDTVARLFLLEPPAAEILIVDQTQKHEAETHLTLMEWEREGKIRWIRVPEPSIPAAMNIGLKAATSSRVLFLDDDIVPTPNLANVHWVQGAPGRLIAGQVLQPGEEATAYGDEAVFRFNSTETRSIDEFMGGNFSVDRREALQIGGFDENFVGAAYRFEAEFAFRWRRSGRLTRFEPSASIRHLRASRGGTRAFGTHLRTFRSSHSVGAYYCLLRTTSGRQSVAGAFRRIVRSVLTRHHARRPWWIPATVVAEISGLIQALLLHRRGPKLISSEREP